MYLRTEKAAQQHERQRSEEEELLRNSTADTKVRKRRGGVPGTDTETSMEETAVKQIASTAHRGP